jgi:hypothetical protein
MPKICYVPKNFSEAKLKTIAIANRILVDYARQGYDLTLRQLYYQFVSRALIANRENEYKNLGSLINDARLAGLIDWKHITDRTREVRQNPHWDSPSQIVNACVDQFQIDKWDRQQNYVEVWVEKDALVGVLEVACKPLDVPYFSCRGYTSQSEMWVAAMRLLEHHKAGQDLYIVHLGDHDPSGIDMTRDIEDRLNLFLEHHVGHRVTINRVALNMPQIEQYTPPPNPAKLTDSRCASYMEKYGDESWELDALEPSVITALIQDTVSDLRDEDLWDEAVREENSHKRALEDAAEFLENRGNE